MLLKGKTAICYIADHSTITHDVFFRYKNNKYCIWQSLKDANMMLFDCNSGENIVKVNINGFNLIDAISILLKTAELNTKYLAFQE